MSITATVSSSPVSVPVSVQTESQRLAANAKFFSDFNIAFISKASKVEEKSAKSEALGIMFDLMSDIRKGIANPFGGFTVNCSGGYSVSVANFLRFHYGLVIRTPIKPVSIKG